MRRGGILPWLRPDAKAQLTFKYEGDRIHSIASCVLSTQHTDEISYPDLQQAILEQLIRPVLPEMWLTEETFYYINPTGRFVLGGPQDDCGLTGRKLMVDTYGGEAFSGKDPSKVDRRATYIARYLAKQWGAAKPARRCEIQLVYAIAVAQPTSVYVDTFGTSHISNTEMSRWVQETFDLTPYALIQCLNLFEDSIPPDRGLWPFWPVGIPLGGPRGSPSCSDLFRH